MKLFKKNITEENKLRLRDCIIIQKLYYILKKIEYHYFFLNNPEHFLQREYKRRLKTNKLINLKDPKTYTEKINWLKLHPINPAIFYLGDKYKSRIYVEKKIHNGSEYLVPIYGYYRNIKEFDFTSLPNRFVLKATHSSGDVIFCSNKKMLTKFQQKKMLKQMQVWLNKDYYKKSKELSYKNAIPAIIVEEYLDSGIDVAPKDYRLFTFNGKVEYISVYKGRYNGSKKINQIVYDTNWNIMPFIFGTLEKFERNLKYKEAAPKCLDEMIYIAEKLSEDFPFLRVDLYVIRGKIYFGELTFYHLNGYFKMTPEKWDKKLGEGIIL